MSTKPKTKPSTASPAASPTRTAKLFKNGRSQAVRLPKEFRFEGNEVQIRRDPDTGEVVLTPARLSRAKRALSTAGESPRPEEPRAPARKLSFEELLAVLDQADFPENFFERRTSMPRELNLFE